MKRTRTTKPPNPTTKKKEAMELLRNASEALRACNTTVLFPGWDMSIAEGLHHRVREQRRCRQLAQRTHPASAQRAHEQCSGSHAPLDRVPRVTPRVEPDAESFEGSAQDGQRRVAGVGPRK